MESPWGSTKEIACDLFLGRMGMLNLSFSITGEEVEAVRQEELRYFGLTESDVAAHLKRLRTADTHSGTA